MTDVLACQSLRKTYGGLVAVDDVSFVADSGEIVGLVGPNGAGKTTLVDLITGVQKPDSGQTTVRGVPLRGSVADRARRSRLARTFQHPQLAPELTVVEQLILARSATVIGGGARLAAAFAMPFGSKRLRTVERDLGGVVKSFGLVDLNRTTADLTLGELRLLEVARSIAQDPVVLLLDEPFAGADAATARRMTEAISTVAAEGCAVVVIDHNVDLVAGLVDRIVLLSNGAVAFDGPTESVLHSEVMHEVYFGGSR